MTEEKYKFWSISNPLAWGTTITILFILVIFSLGWQNYCIIETSGEKFCQSRFKTFLHSSPNEMGDALAGMTGALAFLWIIVTVLIQNLELKAQRLELSAQREELQLNRNESEKIADAMSQQVSLLKNEREIREEERLINLVEENLALVLQKIRFYNPHTKVVLNDGNIVYLLGNSKLKELSGADFYISLANQLYSTSSKLSRAIENKEVNQRSSMLKQISEVHEDIKNTYDTYHDYSDRIAAKINMHRLQKIKGHLTKIIALDIWNIEESDS